MREYEFTFKEEFTKGLSPYDDYLFDGPYLSKCLNLRPLNGVIQPLASVEEYTVSAGEYFTVGDNLYLFTPTVIYQQDIDTKALTVKLVVPAGSRWFMANFLKTAIFTNGTCTVFLNDSGGFEIVSGENLDGIGKIPQAKAICCVNGQVVAVGLQSSFYDRGLNSIAWSKIGSLDFTVDKQNVAGFREADELGELFSVVPFDNTFAIVGKNGIGVLSPAGTTFGFKRVLPISISDANSVASSGSKVFVVDGDGILYSISNEGVAILGFQSKLKDLTTKFTFDRLNNELYISVGTEESLVIGNGTAWSVGKVVNAVGYNKGKTILGISTTTNLSRVIESGIKSFQTAGHKTISEVCVDGFTGVGAQGYTQVQATLGVFKQSKNIPINSMRVFQPYTTGDLFKIGLALPSSGDIKLAGIRVNTIKADYRFGKGRKV